jgi:predicted NBD/HSP70 family sugar kinase
MVNPNGVECHWRCLRMLWRPKATRLKSLGWTSESVDRLADALPAASALEVTRQLDMLIIALRNIVNLFNPKLIVLGVFLPRSSQQDPARLRISAEIGHRCLPFHGVEIRPSELATDLLMIGASELALRHSRDPQI